MMLVSNSIISSSNTSLEKLISPYSVSHFLKEYFEKKPLLIARQNIDYFHSLLTIDQINDYLERKDIRYPSIRLVKDGLELPQIDYLKNLPFGNQVFEGVVDNDSLFSLFSQGATIVFQALHRTIPNMSKLCQDVENFFSFPLQTNIYLTPSSSQGFASHFDNHDVFILQAHGTKIWRVYDSPVYLPTKPFDKSKWEKTIPQIEVELKEGDTLYIPRGFVHDASTTNSSSLHITLGLLTYTWIDVLRMILENSHQNKNFRSSFDWKNADPNLVKEKIKSITHSLINEIDFNEVINKFSHSFSKRRLTSDHNRLKDLIEIDSVNLDSHFIIRNEIVYRINASDKFVFLLFYDKSIRFPLYVFDTLNCIIQSGSFKARELKSNLNNDGKLLLIKTLLREGFISLKSNE